MSPSTLTLRRLHIASPIGDLLALATDRGLCALEFPRSGARRQAEEPERRLNGRSARTDPPDSLALHPTLQRRLDRWFPAHEIVEGVTPILARTRDWLSAYFDSDGDAAPAVTGMNDLPLDLRGAPFEQRVWTALLDIPPGATASYGAIAARLGTPGAARAVGAANGANPVSIIVPCHRVIGSSGKLTGYGGGLDRKKWLLEHEARWRRGWLFSDAIHG